MKTLLSNLRTTIALIVLAAVILGIGLALHRNLEQRRFAAEDAREEVLRLAGVAAGSQQEDIEDTREMLSILAQLPEVRGDDQRACNVLLSRILEQDPRYANLGVIDRDGYAVCSALPRPGQVYLGDRSYFRRAIATRDFAVGEYQVGRITGRPGINFGYPVLDEDGAVQGVVFAAIDLTWLNNLAASLNLQEGAVLFTVDRQGTILSRYPDGTDWVGQTLPEAPLVETVLGTQGEGTTEMAGLDGISRFYAFMPLSRDEEVGAHIVMGIPTAAAYVAADRDLTRSLLGQAFLALLFFAVAWAYADLFILRRVRALVQAARRLTGDDLSARTGLPYVGGEFGELARTFDEMAATLERRMRRLRALNAIDRAITARHELPQTLDVVLQQVTSQLDVDAAAILLLDRLGGHLQYAAGRGFQTAGIQATRLKLGEGFSGQVALERRPVFIQNLEKTEAFAQAPLLQGEGFVSFAGVPLVAEGEIQGVLSVWNRTPLNFENEWVAFLEALALQAAIAIDNAQLLEKTREQTRQLQQVVDTMPEGVLMLDAQHKVLVTNPLGETYACALANATIDDTMKRLGDQPLATFLQPAGDDQNWHELTLPQEDRTFEVAGQAVRDNGHLDGWVLVLREVTEERKRQEYMQTHERLATLGQAAAGIAHDFNNIMAVIVMNSQVLARTPDHPRREHYLATIQEQARMAADVVSQILDFSRSSEVQMVRLDPSTFLAEEVELLRHLLPSNIEVTLQDDEVEHAIAADPTRLRQILMNLAVNARDAMSQGGQLRITASSLSLTPSMAPPLPDMEPGEYVCLSVSDSGAGIPADLLPRIFEPFFTTKQRGQGTGLGLAQVYGLVKQHGGAIEVDSTPGKGTAFMIYLPALARGCKEPLI